MYSEHNFCQIMGEEPRIVAVPPGFMQDFHWRSGVVIVCVNLFKLTIGNVFSLLHTQ